MEYYNSLTRLMQQHNLTAAKLAELLKCSVRTVRNWECGTSRPGRQLMSALEKVFAVSGSVLFPENVFELADLRKSRNMSEDELAELVHCDVSVIHKFEQNDELPDKATLKSIAAVFEIPLYSISVTPPRKIYRIPAPFAGVHSMAVRTQNTVRNVLLNVATSAI